MDSNTTVDIDGPLYKQAPVLSKRFWIIPWLLAYNRLELDCIRKITNFWYTFGWKWRVFVTIWDCRTHVRMTSMTSSVERTDLDFKISVALAVTDNYLYCQGRPRLVLTTVVEILSKPRQFFLHIPCCHSDMIEILLERMQNHRIIHHNMNHVLRKPIFAICEQ